ncbi:unnamed protein product [Lactuca saligna]|uniref:AB hydrolase-1 domain-containing protein n=1 Tax=Lactuca saligna TaxID=75948 RepID=A0AA35ZS20_LACSI|nr:unnamed protein product [Lactuca saligna]
MSVIAFKEIFNSSPGGSEKPYSFTAFLIHGLLGCGDDFADFATSLVTSLSTDWRMVLVDLRCHGNSTDREGLTPPNDTANAARDLANLVKSLDWDWPDVVIGHSLGGKVALQYALSCANGDYGDSAQLPKQVWVIDVGPGKAEDKSQYQELVNALQKLHTLPSLFPSQEWLLNQMIDLGFPEFLSVWISNSLKKSGEYMTFSFDIDGAIQLFESAVESDYWSLLEEPPRGMEIAIVRTESQVSWTRDVVERLESLANRESDESRGKVSVYVVSDSGHWIYRDQPERLLEIMTPRMASLVRFKL